MVAALEQGGEGDLFAAEIILGELLSNVARYTPGPYCTEIVWGEDGRATVVIHDAGGCFRLDRYDSARPMPGGDAERGRGFSMIRALGASVEADVSAAGCRVSATVPVVARPGRPDIPTYCPEGPRKARLGRCARPARLSRDGRTQHYGDF